MESGVIWITGMPGSGKTTLANQLIRQVQHRRPILLDGDQLRAALNDHDYSLEGRKKLSLQYAGLAHMLAEQGHLVVVSVVAMYREVHEWNRLNNQHYIEIFLKPTNETLIKRNKKGLYAPGGDFQAAHSAQDQLKIEFPLNPDLTFDSGEQSPQTMANILLGFLEQKLREA